jgi:hypothetical protein
MLYSKMLNLTHHPIKKKQVGLVSQKQMTLQKIRLNRI